MLRCCLGAVRAPRVCTCTCTAARRGAYIQPPIPSKRQPHQRLRPWLRLVVAEPVTDRSLGRCSTRALDSSTSAFFFLFVLLRGPPEASVWPDAETHSINRSVWFAANADREDDDDYGLLYADGIWMR